MQQEVNIPKLRYPLSKYSSRYLLETYERVCLFRAVWCQSQWEWEHGTPVFNYCRRQVDDANKFLADLSEFLVIKRDFDLGYLINLEVRCIEDVNA